MNSKFRIIGKAILIIIIFTLMFLGANVYAYNSLSEDDKYQFYIDTSYPGDIGGSSHYFEIGERINIKKLLTFAPIDNDYVYNDKTQEWEEVNPKMDIILNKLGVYSSNEDVIAVEIEEELDGATNSVIGIYLKCKKAGSTILTADYYYNNKHYIVQAEYPVIAQEDNGSFVTTESTKDNTQNTNVNLNNSNNQNNLNNQSSPSNLIIQSNLSNQNNLNTQINSNAKSDFNIQKSSSQNNDEFKNEEVKGDNNNLKTDDINIVNAENETINTENYNSKLIRRYYT